MSLIGNVGQLNLSLVLQRIEAYAKTGLLAIKQEVQWVELYFRNGRLMCIGPVRANATLGDRLLQAGIVSFQALQEAMFTVETLQSGETRMVLTLIDLGYLNHEILQAWAAKEAAGMLQVLLTWQCGEIYFEEGLQPPLDRLLIALSPTSLLPATTVDTPIPQSVRSMATSPLIHEQAIAPTAPAPSVPAPTPALRKPSRLVSEGPSPLMTTQPPPESDLPFSTLNIFSNPGLPVSQSPMEAKRVTAPLAPRHIDTSFMRPEMVLMPLDLSALRAQNPQLALTPEQWRLLTRVDGRTSLQMACQELTMSPDLIRQIAGELIVLGLVHLIMPVQEQVDELSPISRDLITAGLGNGYLSPGYAASAALPWVAITPTTDALPPFPSSVSFETQSQWGNGGNGAIFVPGRGWIATPQPMQPLQPSGSLYITNNI